MSTKDRFWPRGEQGRLVSLEDVVRTGRYASHRSLEGQLFEYDQGRLWRTDLRAAEPQRVPIADGPATPLGPWHHHSFCDCEFCAPAGEGD